MDEDSPQNVRGEAKMFRRCNPNRLETATTSIRLPNTSTTPADLLNPELPKEEEGKEVTATSPISSDDSPEEMLMKMTFLYGQMISAMKHLQHHPNLENGEAATAALPGFLDSPGRRVKENGPTFNVSFASAIGRILEQAGRTFKLLDDFQKWVDGLRSIKAFENASTESGSTNLNASPPSLPSQPQQKPSPPSDFENHRAAFLTRTFQKSDTLLYLAIEQISQSLVTIPEEHPGYLFLQAILSLCYLHLYELCWENGLLEDGMRIATLALDKILPHPEFGRTTISPLAPVTAVRSCAYGQRLLVQRDGDVSNWQDTVSIIESCWTSFKDIETLEDRPKTLLRKELALCLIDRYRLTGSLNDLNSSIGHLKALLPDDDDLGLSIDETIELSLGMAYYERFLHCGDVEDLDSALYHCQCRLAPNAAGKYLHALGLAERFKATWNTMDLDRAVTHCRMAVDNLHRSHPLLPSYKSSLALILYARYEVTKDAQDIESALQVIRTAVEESKAVIGRQLRVPPEAIQGYLTVMSLDTTDANMTAIEEGIRMITKSRKAFSGAVHIESKIEGYLSKSLLRLFQSATIAGASDDDRQDYFDSALDHAILAFQKAPEDSPSKHQFGLDMAHLILQKYQQGRSLDCDEAIAQFCTTAVSSTWPSIRLEGAIQWANALEVTDTEGALDALREALDIMPSVASLGEHMPTQYKILSRQRFGIPQRAAMYAIDAEDLMLAVSCLEKGRNILWAQALQIRAGDMLTPGGDQHKEFKSLSGVLWVKQLLQGDPHNAEDVEDLKRCLPPDQSDQYSQMLRVIEGARSEITKKLVGLVGRERVNQDNAMMNKFREGMREVYNIASLHGTAKRWNELASDFDKVQQALSFDETTQRGLVSILKATKGSVVILNVYGSRCDGVVISAALDSDKLLLHHVPFPDLSSDKIHEWADRLRKGMKSLVHEKISLDEYETEYLIPVLRGLWRGVACPILRHFSMQPSVGDDTKRRIWWYPTRRMIFVPVHAASPCEGSELGLLDLIVSSYIPSIHSLVRASKSPSLPVNILAVGQPETLGLSALPYAEKEIKALKRSLREDPKRLTILMGEEGKTYPVLNAIPNHTFLHLSCHAHQDEQYPFNSAFYFHDGPLKLPRIMNLDLSKVQFAYLSACLTSAGDTAVPDESIHLAAGMQFAGVGSVVATMWSVEDRVAAAVSSRVYGHLLRNGAEKADASMAVNRHI